MDLLFRLNKEMEGFGDISEAKQFFSETLPTDDNNHFYSVKVLQGLDYGDKIYFSYDSYLVASAIFMGEITNEPKRDEKFKHGHRVKDVEILDVDIRINNHIMSSWTTYLTQEKQSEIDRVLAKNTSGTLTADIELIVNQETTDTEKLAQVKSRIGQDKFRKSLIDYWGKCSVTEYTNIPMLLASHIKPWAKSSNSERLDKFNGLLLTPTLDRAFDKGLISFSKTGEILISPALHDPNALGIDKGMSFQSSEKHDYHMQYHREHIYKKV